MGQVVSQVFGGGGGAAKKREDDSFAQQRQAQDAAAAAEADRLRKAQAEEEDALRRGLRGSRSLFSPGGGELGFKRTTLGG